MDLDSASMLTVVLGFFSALVVGYILVRQIRKKNMGELKRLQETGGVDEESAYSALVSTQRILDYVRRGGYDVSSAKELLLLAKQSYGLGKYVAAVSYCSREKKLLLDSKNKMSQEQYAETDEDQETAFENEEPKAEREEERTMARVSRDSDKEEEDITSIEDLGEKAEDALVHRDNKLPSKFMIQRAKEALERATGRGDDVEEVLENLDLAEEAFDKQQYNYALSYANRARKIAEGEDISELPPTKPEASVDSSEDVGPTEAFPCPNCGEELEPGAAECPGCGAEIAQQYVCPGCGGEVLEDSTFCRHCGMKLLEEMVVCPSCDSTIPSDSAFCPKCGEKME